MGIPAILGVSILLAHPGPEATAADAITLRDGKVALGQVVEPSPRGRLTFIVRRAWAGEHLPEWAKKWEAAEKPWVKRARAERLDRLKQWKAERVPDGDKDDAILAWLDEEIERLQEDDPEPTPLMLVSVGRSDVKSVKRRDKDAGRMLRQGWIARFDDVESRPLEELKSDLQGRGFAMSDVDPAPVDRLLPIPVESDRRWLARRAATEVAQEPTLRFVRHLGLVLPERTGAGEGDLQGARAALNLLLNDHPGDPLLAQAREVASRGRVGLVETRLEMAEDLSAVRVESTLWVRTGHDHWEKAVVRPAVVKPGELKAQQAEAIAADPQVDAVFRMVEGMGLGKLSPEMKARSLNIGAATREALAQAKGMLEKDLDALALPVVKAGATETKENETKEK